MNAPSRDGRGRDSCWRPDGSQVWTSLCGLAPFQATDDALEELLLKAKWISVLDLFLSTALRKELSSLNCSLCLAQKLLLMARLVSVLTDFLHEPAISISVSMPDLFLRSTYYPQCDTWDDYAVESSAKMDNSPLDSSLWMQRYTVLILGTWTLGLRCSTDNPWAGTAEESVSPRLSWTVDAPISRMELCSS